MTPTLTERHLQIPVVMALKYRRDGDPDEIRSTAGEALVMALHCFNPDLAHDHFLLLPPEDQERVLGGYLLQRVEWAVRNYLWPTYKNRRELRWRALVSLDLPFYPADRRQADRHNRRVVRLMDTLAVHQDPSLPAEKRDEVGRAHRILARLDATDREVYVLYHVGGMTMREVAARLGRSRARIEQRLRRASARIEKLKKEMSCGCTSRG